MKAVESQAQRAQSALAELCRVYWHLLYIFARCRGHSPDDAQEATQRFFLPLLEQRSSQPESG
jgi:DNA-directed RNA polymerase specialized sigma24 family protein